MPDPSIVPVLTASYDSCRSNANLHETKLTPAYLRAQGVRQTFSLFLDGDQRGSEGQPLIVPNVLMSDGIRHDICIVATMANDVYAFDVETHDTLWQRRISNPIPGIRKMDMYLINDNWGILSTPVVDPDEGLVYVVSMHSPTGQFSDSSHHLHAIRLSDGSEDAPALNLSATATYQPPDDLPLQRMGAVPRKQRCALALDKRNGVSTVYVANGSFLESAKTNQGWLIAVDVSTGAPEFAAAWTTTSRYSGGGLWMGSQGPMIDPASGDIAVCVGNGAFDGKTDFGESVVRLRYTPAKAGKPAAISVVSHYTPFTDMGRVYGAKYQDLADPSLLPKNVAVVEDDDNATDAGPAASNMDSAGDEDLNSGAPLLITNAMSDLGRDIIVVCGKDGIGYVLDADDLGSPALAEFAPATIKEKVYSKPLWIGWLTYHNAKDSPTPTDLSKIPTTYYGYTHHLHGTCAFYRSSVHGPMIFCMGENGNLRAWRINPDCTLTYLACSAEYASADCKAPPGGMPGGMLTLSANGDKPNTALVYVCMPYGNANNSISPGRFLIYDAENFGTYADGSKQLLPVWDSERWGVTYKHCKFSRATVSGGRIFLPTYEARVIVLE